MLVYMPVGVLYGLRVCVCRCMFASLFLVYFDVCVCVPMCVLLVGCVLCVILRVCNVCDCMCLYDFCLWYICVLCVCVVLSV